MRETFTARQLRGRLSVDDSDDNTDRPTAAVRYRDTDVDGNVTASDTDTRCTSIPPHGYFVDNTDCATDCGAECHPGALAICDGEDNECDG